MAEIISFPTRSVSEWAILERGLHDALTEQGVSDTARARLIERMKSFYGNFQNLEFSLSVNAEYPKIIPREQAHGMFAQFGQKIGADVSKKLQEFTYGIFIDRLHVEIELCRALGMI
jgi:hypothetical protein